MATETRRSLNGLIAIPLAAILILAVVPIISSTAKGIDLLVTDDNLWFDPADLTPVRISVEIGSVTLEQVSAALTQSLGDAQFKKVASGDIQFRSDLLNGTLRLDARSGTISLNSNQATHAAIVKINHTLRQLELNGATSPGVETPLAVRAHDMSQYIDFLASVSGVKKETITALDQAIADSKGKPVIFRYYIGNDFRYHPNSGDTPDPLKIAEMQAINGPDVVIGQLPGNSRGLMPLFIPGQSVVFHARTFHATNILGQYNPGLVNAHIVQVLTDNKWIEANFWKDYAPQALPETVLLHDLIKSHSGASHSVKTNLAEILNKRFPKGWVLKGVMESSSNFDIVTDKIDIRARLESYYAGDFLSFLAKTKKEYEGQDLDILYSTLQEHRDYIGWRISEYMKQPKRAIVQARLPLDFEYRVEAVAGHILHGATIDRHNWLLAYNHQPLIPKNPEAMRIVGKFAQTVINKLPVELRETNFAWDIATLKGGGASAIESNAGSESGFLFDHEEAPESVLALNQFLRQYPAAVAKGKIRGHGLQPRDQMKYLKEKFNQWGIDPNIHLPNIKLSIDGTATDLKPYKVDRRFIVSTVGQPNKFRKALTCHEIFGAL